MNDPPLLVEVRNCLVPFIAISTVNRKNVSPGRVCRRRSSYVLKHNVLPGRVWLRCVHVCVLTCVCVDGGAVMFKNITFYLGECHCGVCVYVLTCACVDGGDVMFKGECRCGVFACGCVLCIINYMLYY